MGYLMLKPSQQWYYLTHSWGDKEVYNISKSISMKENAIAWLDFKPAYFKAAV